jgi:hypothetical protein
MWDFFQLVGPWIIGMSSLRITATQRIECLTQKTSEQKKQTRKPKSRKKQGKNKKTRQQDKQEKKTKEPRKMQVLFVFFLVIFFSSDSSCRVFFW